MPHRNGNVFYLDQYRTIPLDKVHDPKAEEPLGRYNLIGAISDAQYDAGCKFRREVMQYRRILDCRKERQSIAGFGQPQPSTPKELTDAEAIEILRDYMEAFEAIGDRTCQMAVKHVVVQELELDSRVFGYLELGLSRLVAHYGLTRG